jgi:hypothetical protein
MIHFYINTEDIYNFAKLININFSDLDNIVVSYYNTQEEGTIMVSMNMNSFIFLTDNDYLKPIQLLNN